MNLFNSRPKTITLDDQKSVLRGSRNPVTGQAVLMIETDAESHRRFIAEFVAALKPEGMFALGHSEHYANIQSAHPGNPCRHGPGAHFPNRPQTLRPPRPLRAKAHEEFPRQHEPAPAKEKAMAA